MQHEKIGVLTVLYMYDILSINKGEKNERL